MGKEKSNKPQSEQDTQGSNRQDLIEKYRETLKNAYHGIIKDMGTEELPELKKLIQEYISAERYAKENSLWVDDLYSLGKPFEGGGTESVLALNEAEGAIYKAKAPVKYENSVLNLLKATAIHNDLFPETAYELIGFTCLEERAGIKKIRLVLKQKYISGARKATPQEIEEYMTKRGFKKN